MTEVQTQSSDAANNIVWAVTWLNMTGDITITWDEENREEILNLVRDKMKQGYSFFVLTPRKLQFMGNKKVPLTKEAQLKNAVGVIVSDNQVKDIISNLGDKEVEGVVNKGVARLIDAPKSKLETTRRAKTAEEVVKNVTVAIRPLIGG